MNNMNFRRVFRDLPTLETDRLLLKKISVSDAEDMYSYASLNSVTRFLLWYPHLNIEDTRGYIEFLNRQYKKGTYADWGVFLKSENRLIGTTGFADFDFENNSGEVGYVLNPAYQGKGYMTEAVKAILGVAFDRIGLNKVNLRIMEENKASIRLAERSGFAFEKIGEEPLNVKGVDRTILYYALTKEKWDDFKK